MKFTIIPAIDLKGGKCVRLRQGRADDSRVYSEDPAGMARHWAEQGAKCLHVVDLDGAFEGMPVHGEIIGRIVKAFGGIVEVGGGLRTDADIAGILEKGVARAIVGTRAFAEPAALAGLVKRFGKRLAVGIDARNGMVQVKGWVETTGMKAVDLAVKADGMGVRTIIYTDTSTDGMMAGTNADAVKGICDVVKCDVIASGGVTSVADIRRLLALKKVNLAGAIVGKALYEGAVSLADLMNSVDMPAAE